MKGAIEAPSVIIELLLLLLGPLMQFMITTNTLHSLLLPTFLCHDYY